MVRCVPRRLRIAALLLLLVQAASAQAPPPGGEDLSGAREILAGLAPELLDVLEKDRVVMLQEFDKQEVYGGRIHALVLFERPRNEVIRYLIQSPRQIEYRPELRKASLVEESDSAHVVEFEIRMMLMRITYRVKHGWDFESGRVWWALDPDFDNDLAVLEGEWEVHAMEPGRTLARFGTRIDVGPALPDFLQDYATRKQLPKAMHNVRRWVDSGGTYRP